jgi:hypothetical protein
MPSLKNTVLWLPLRWNPTDICNSNNEASTFSYFESPFTMYSEYLAWGIEYAVAGQTSVVDTGPRRVIRAGREIR